MALKKNKIWQGITCNYWKIAEARENFINNTTEIALILYHNDESRLDNINNRLHAEIIVVDGVELTREQQYAKIKETVEFFADAEDA